MPIKHSFSVLFCNFKLVGKIFFFILVVTIIAAAVLTSITSPVIKGYFKKLQDEMPISPDELIKHPIKSLERFLHFFTEFVEENADMVSTRVVFMVLVLVLSRFLLMLPIMPVTKIIHEKMTSGFDVGLTNAFITTLWQNLLFSLLFSLVIGFVDLLILVGLVYLTSWLMALLGVIALPVCLLIALSVYALRITLVCQWLPEYCLEHKKNVYLSLGTGLKSCFAHFGKNYICMFVLTIIGFTSIAVTLVPTLGLLPILLVPTLMVMYVALSLSLCYTYHKQKYFTDNGVTVYNPVKKY